MSSEFYLNENPFVTDESSSGDGGGAGGGGGSSQGGWSGGPGIGQEASGGWGDIGEDGGEDDGIPSDWGDDRINQPFLRSLAGYLIVDQTDGKLLTGSLSCNIPPALVIRSEDTFDVDENGEKEETVEDHQQCVLVKCDPIDPPDDDADSRLYEIDGVDKDQEIIRVADFSFCNPGSFKISIKWQAGHYDYAKMNKLCCDLWGISTGFKQFPLSNGNWILTFSVTVTDEFAVIVNQQPGDVRANEKYFGKDE